MSGISRNFPAVLRHISHTDSYSRCLIAHKWSRKCNKNQRTDLVPGSCRTSQIEGTPMAPSIQALGTAEALTMPRVQVIVLNANMRCQECRERVSQVLSKMDNLLDYVVDVTQKKVIVRGRVDPKKRMKRLSDQRKGTSAAKSVRSGGAAETEEKTTAMMRYQNIIKTTFCFGKKPLH